MGCHSGSGLTLFKGVGPKGKGHQRVNPGFGECWFIPPLLVSAYLTSTSFIWRIFLGRHTSRRDLSSCGVYRSKSWCLEGFRIWKLSRTYPGEKPPSFSVLTHMCSLATRKPTWHLLTMPYILVRIGAPYEGGWSTQFHLPRNYDTIFNPRYI